MTDQSLEYPEYPKKNWSYGYTHTPHIPHNKINIPVIPLVYRSFDISVGNVGSEDDIFGTTVLCCCPICDLCLMAGQPTHTPLRYLPQR